MLSSRRLEPFTPGSRIRAAKESKQNGRHTGYGKKVQLDYHLKLFDQKIKSLKKIVGQTETPVRSTDTYTHSYTRLLCNAFANKRALVEHIISSQG